MWLVVNAGSSSVKLRVFDAALEEVARAAVDRIGAGGAADHASALAQGLAEMGVEAGRLAAAAHRVVHGGADLRATCRVTPEVEAQIEACAALAPLHNPANLTGIRALRALAPALPQYAAFDTAFHATNPEVAVTYALPAAERERGLRRYGFHGLSYAAVVRKVQETVPSGAHDRLLVFHLGNGASICAIQGGRSVATTMGYSPLDGLTMGTRAGSLDPAVVLDLSARHGIDGAARILNRNSGLLALGGSNDLRSLRAAGTPEAAFALDHFAYWAIRHAGSLIAAMGGLDAIAFTGGIGENDAAMRAKILAGLEFVAKGKPVHVVPADEERQIALEAAALREAE
ncbi:MAG: acetate kinase [Fuscovulum sp.]|nr:acetate kinase [Fuscovulum sp.]